MLNLIANVLKVWGSSFGAARTISRPGTIVNSKYMHRGTMQEAFSTSPGIQTPIYQPSIARSRSSMPRSLMARSPMARISIPRTPSPVFMHSKEKKSIHPEVEIKVEDIDDESIDDPEAGKAGVARRPMLLTHSVMMGLVIILLFTVISVILGMVNIRNPSQIGYTLTILTACDRNQI